MSNLIKFFLSPASLNHDLKHNFSSYPIDYISVLKKGCFLDQDSLDH